MAETYLNNAGTSFPKPPAVPLAIAQRLRTEPAEYAAWFELNRSQVAALLGVVAERLLLTSSCTQALEVAITSLPWQAGDCIITSHLEHHGVIRPVETLVRHLDVKHTRIPYRPGVPFDLDDLRTELKNGKVRLVALCAASNVTGEILPLPEVCELAHEFGALVLADGAQSFGLLEDTPGKLGCDLFAFAGHKYPLGPQGIGGLWVREGVAFDSTPVVCEAASKAACRDLPMPDYCDVGGVNMPGLAGLAEGLQAYGHDRKLRMQAARNSTFALVEMVRDEPGLRIHGHHGGPQTATLSVSIEQLPVSHAEAHFAARGLRIRAGTHCAPDALNAIGAHEGTIRISFGPENTPQHLQAVAQAIRQACRT